MKIASCLLGMAVLAVSFTASAQGNERDIGNGNVLHEYLLDYMMIERNEAPQGTSLLDANEALGYIAGVHDSLQGLMFCTPAGSTRGQIVHVVLKYLDANPEKWQMNSSVLIVVALETAFPCPKKKP
jgi:hypothetical protein